jgi:hypothetical protein
MLAERAQSTQGFDVALQRRTASLFKLSKRKQVHAVQRIIDAQCERCIGIFFAWSDVKGSACSARSSSTKAEYFSTKFFGRHMSKKNAVKNSK